MSETQNSEPKYTDVQFARYVVTTLFRNLVDLESAVNFMHNGKFFAAENRMIGARDSLSHLKKQAERRLVQLGEPPEELSTEQQ